MCVTFRCVDVCSLSKLKNSVKVTWKRQRERLTVDAYICGWAVNPNFIPNKKLWYKKAQNVDLEANGPSGDPPHNPEHKDTKQIIFQSEHSPIFVINILNPILFINITFTFTTNILSQYFPTSQSQWSGNVRSCGCIF